MESKNNNPFAKIIIIIAIVLILLGIFIAIFKNRDNQTKTYYATFIVEGVVYQSDVTIKDGYISRLPESPKKDGYIFDHWEIDGREYTGLEKLTDNVILIAVFKEAKENQIVVITFNKDNGEQNSTVEIIKNEKVTPISEPEKEGYEFLGWYLNDEEFSFDTIIHENITLIAKWKVLSFTVKFDSKGGNNISSQEIKYKEKIETPKTPIRTGYKFLGWYLNNKKYDFNTEITKDITLVAKWEKVENNEKIAYGDINEDGVVNSKDALKLAKYFDLGEKITNQAKKNADVNADGKVNYVDYVIILAYSSGRYDEKLPNSPIKNYTLYGDLNEDGLLTNDDYNKLSSYISNNTSISEQAKKNADVNGNGKIDEVDLKNLKARLDKLAADNIKYNSNRTASSVPIVDYVSYGDVDENGTIDIRDSAVLEKYLDKLQDLNAQAKKNADVNDDEKVNRVDLVLLYRYNANWYENTLPSSPIKDYIMYGDINEDGLVDEQDSIKLQSYIAGTDTLENQAKKNADVNNDDSINDTDYQLLLQYLVDVDNGEIPANPLS